MNDNKSRDIFYGVVAIATLIVALVGATLAYFSISVSSSEGAVSARAATVSIDYQDGQQVIAQASELIPATFEVVKQAYENNASAINAQAELDEEEARSNVCLDSNNREVCSVYRFSVKSDITRDVTATLNNEYNGFQYLAYAVRDVTNNTWLTLVNDNEGARQFIALSRCDNGDEDTNKHCFTTSGETKQYNANTQAFNPVFGYDNSNNYISKSVSSTTQTYDIVIFLKENNAPQNEDQGKNYRGTIVVDVLDQNGVTGIITGCIGNECQP